VITALDQATPVTSSSGSRKIAEMLKVLSKLCPLSIKAVHIQPVGLAIQSIAIAGFAAPPLCSRPEYCFWAAVERLALCNLQTVNATNHETLANHGIRGGICASHTTCSDSKSLPPSMQTSASGTGTPPRGRRTFCFEWEGVGLKARCTVTFTLVELLSRALWHHDLLPRPTSLQMEVNEAAKALLHAK